MIHRTLTLTAVGLTAAFLTGCGSVGVQPVSMGQRSLLIANWTSMLVNAILKGLMKLPA